MNLCHSTAYKGRKTLMGYQLARLSGSHTVAQCLI